MLASQCEIETNKNKERLFHHFYKKILKEIKKEIKRAIKKGEDHLYYHFHYYSDCGFSSVGADVKKIITEFLETNGFYVRRYSLGMPMGFDEYIIAWTPECIKKYREVDEASAIVK